MPPKGHAVLSASSSERWLHCPPSARLCETYEDRGSDYAAEGTDAHTLCEYKLRRALGMEAEDPTEHLFWYNEEINDCADGYAVYVLEQVEAAKQEGLLISLEQFTKNRAFRTAMFVLVLAAGAFMRLYALGQVPRGINSDEAMSACSAL